MKNLSLLVKFEILIGYFLFVLGFNSLYKALANNLPAKLGPVYLYSFYIMIFAIIFTVIIKSLHKKQDMGFKNPKDWKLMLYFLFLLMPVALFGRIFDGSFDFWYADQVGMYTASGLLVFMATMPFFVVKEELIERSIFQSRLQVSYGFWITMFAISLNFSLAHFSLYIPFVHSAWQTVSVFIGSFLLVAFYFITRNIWLAIILHLVYNLLISLQIFLHVNDPVKEVAFWLVYGLGFVIIAKKAFLIIHHKIPKFKVPNLKWDDWLFLVLFAIVIPLFLIFKGVIIEEWMFGLFS